MASTRDDSKGPNTGAGGMSFYGPTQPALNSSGFGGCSFLRDCHRHSAVHRSPRSRSSASLRSRSALVLSCSAGPRYRTARGLLMSQSLHHARSSFSEPRITIWSASSGNGRCNALASSHGARIQTSHSSWVVRMTGIALGWIGSTMALGTVVRNA